MLKYKKVLLFVNRAIYLFSAAMLMAGLALTATPPKVVEACHPVAVCDVPDYTTISVLSDNLTQWFSDHPEDFEINAGHPCTPPPPVCDASKHEVEDPANPGKCICDAGWEKNGNTCQPEVKVTICHATSSSTNPYNEITVSGNSLDNSGSWMNGHGKDPDDIWASFTLRDGTVVPAQGDQDTLNNHCVVPTPIDVCLVPGYSTVQIMPSALAAYLEANPNAFVIDGQHPCTPPINYIPVCDVPTTIDGSYTTINVAEGELAAWFASHSEDFLLAAGGTCAPTLIDVCLVPAYTTTRVDQLFLAVFLAAHQGSFVPSLDEPCEEPTVLVCHVPAYETESMTISAWLAWLIDHQLDYTVENNGQCKPPEQKIWVCHVPEGNPASAHTIQVSINSWDDDSGTGHKGHLLDFEVTGPDDPTCPPPTVQYCHYSASAYLWTQETGYLWEISDPDYILNAGESCPVKLEYCRYDVSSDTYTNVQLYPADVSANDSVLEQGGICPSKIGPTTQCVWNNGDGSVDAVFAYNNPNAGTISIPIGTDNDLSGSGAFLGGPQPTDFLTGVNSSAFIVTFLDMKTVSWFIKSPDFANGITAIAASTGPACQDDPKKELKPVVLLDPYCYSIPGTLMQWTVENSNDVPFNVDSWSIDGVPQSGGFVAPVGESLLTTTALGSHTVDLYWGLTGHSALRYTINSCTPEDKDPTPGPTPTEKPKTKVTPQVVAPLPIPVTGQGGEIIPVTGADRTPFSNIWVFAGFGMFGFGMVLSGLRKRLGL